MLQHKGTNIMKTERLTLRPLTVDDAPSYFSNLVNDKEVLKYTAWPYHDSMEKTKEMLASWRKHYDKVLFYNWAVELDGTLIGNLTVYRIYEDDCALEIGYCFGKEYWNKGYATEAAKAAIGYLVAEVKAKKIIVSFASPNPASGRVAEKCGMQYVKTEEDAFTTRDGEVVDVITYELSVQ